jgi:hypothetical protein
MIAIAFVPAVAVSSAVSFNELLPDAGFVIVAGVKVAPTPAGNPVTDKVSGPENPPVTDVVIGSVTLALRVTDAVAELLTVNPLTTNVTTTVGAGDTPPPVPVTVIG